MYLRVLHKKKQQNMFRKKNGSFIDRLYIVNYEYYMYIICVTYYTGSISMLTR